MTRRLVRVTPVLFWTLLLPCYAAPLVWVAWQILTNPIVWTEARVDGYRLQLLGRTLAYSALVGVISVVISVPVAVVIGRGRVVARTLLAGLVPVTLLLPSLVYAYGWSQCLRLLDLKPPAQSVGDVTRCIGSLAAWLWPVPAVVMGLALRRLDQNVQQHALLDGALWRVTGRQLLAPAVASFGIVTGLASQEFAVYEPTGISVLATEIRMVYETGTFSSPDNPITQPMGGGSGFRVQGSAFPGDTNALGSPNRAPQPPPAALLASARASLPSSQSNRAASAVAVSLPGIAIILIATILGTWCFTRSDHSAPVDAGPLPGVLLAGPIWTLASVIVLLVAAGVPLASLVLSLKQHRALADVLDEFSPQVIGSLVLSCGAGIVAMALAGLTTIRRSRGGVILAILTFLVGGQILAIALVRIYNHRVFEPWLYNGPGVVIVAYVARFGWIALVAGLMTWTRPWRELRDLAGVDGADAMQTARWVLFPLVWPMLLAAGLFVMILGLSEVPATVLLSPQRPPTFTPMLMQWVHMLRSDPMIEGSLLIVAVVLVLGAIGSALVWLGLRRGAPVPRGAR